MDKACKSCDATANTQLLTTNFMSFRFRNFKVYKDAIEAYKLIIKVTQKFPSNYYHLSDQMKRASLSVVLNIAEGSAKNSDKDFNRYLGNSLGSTNEVVAATEVASSINLISDNDKKEIISVYLEITNQLGGFSKKLKS